MAVPQELDRRPGCRSKETFIAVKKLAALQIRWLILNPREEEDFIGLLENERVNPEIRERALAVLLAFDIKELPFRVNTPRDKDSYLGGSFKWLKEVSSESAEQAAVIVKRNIEKIRNEGQEDKQAWALDRYKVVILALLAAVSGDQADELTSLLRSIK